MGSEGDGCQCSQLLSLGQYIGTVPSQCHFYKSFIQCEMASFSTHLGGKGNFSMLSGREGQCFKARACLL